MARRLINNSKVLWALLAVALFLPAAPVLGQGQPTPAPTAPAAPTAPSAPATAPLPPGPFAGFQSTDKTPVEIHADRMEVNLATKKLVFLGHVIAKQGKRTIYADRMDVNYTQDGKVTRLEAKGNVKVNMGDSFATSDQLILDNVKQIIYLNGRPRLVQGEQIIVGEKMVYEMVPERLIVTNPRIQFQPGKGPIKEEKKGEKKEAPKDQGPGEKREETEKPK